MGDLTIPQGAKAIVLFAHGSGSSRRSPRNQFVARQLSLAGLATLLFDLLTPAEEERDRGQQGNKRVRRSEKHGAGPHVELPEPHHDVVEGAVFYRSVETRLDG